MAKQRNSTLSSIEILGELGSCQTLIQNLIESHAAKDQQLRDQNQQLRDQDIKRQQQEQNLDTLSKEYEELQLAYNKLLQQRFGNRSERYIEAPTSYDWTLATPTKLPTRRMAWSTR